MISLYQIPNLISSDVEEKMEMLLENHQCVWTYQYIRSLNCDKALKWDYFAFQK